MKQIDRIDPETREEVLDLLESEGGLRREDIVSKGHFKSEDEAGEVVSDLMDLGYITSTSDRRFVVRESE
jgi:hypothetical protein